MKKYRVRERGWADARCANVTAQTPQHAAEVYVECHEATRSNGDEVDVVVIDDSAATRHNIVVRVEWRMILDGRKPRDLQKEEW